MHKNGGGHQENVLLPMVYLSCFNSMSINQHVNFCYIENLLKI